MMVAIGMAPETTLFLGSTIKELGVVPKLHWRTAPAKTALPMGITRTLQFSSILLLSTYSGNNFGEYWSQTADFIVNLL
jgi:hypothetical protein